MGSFDGLYQSLTPCGARGFWMSLASLVRDLVRSGPVSLGVNGFGQVEESFGRERVIAVGFGEPSQSCLM